MGKTDQFFDRLYEPLRRIARRLMRNERLGHSLGPTDLVHGIYGRNLGQWDSRTQFLGNARRSMEQLLVDYARQRSRLKRGGPDAERQPLQEDLTAIDSDTASVVDRDALDAAMADVAAESPRAGDVIRLRFQSGLSHDQIAKRLGVTRRTVDRDWRFARSLLFARLDRAYGDA